jgi:hypothetical protein
MPERSIVTPACGKKLPRKVSKLGRIVVAPVAISVLKTVPRWRAPPCAVVP